MAPLAMGMSPEPNNWGFMINRYELHSSSDATNTAWLVADATLSEPLVELNLRRRQVVVAIEQRRFTDPSILDQWRIEISNVGTMCVRLENDMNVSGCFSLASLMISDSEVVLMAHDGMSIECQVSRPLVTITLC